MYFNGTQFDWIATKNNSSGNANVYVDDISQGTVSLANATATPLYQRTVWSKSTSPGVHKVRIVWAATTGKYINIDAVDVVGSLRRRHRPSPVSVLRPARPPVAIVSPSTGPGSRTFRGPQQSPLEG
jgi:hypothetical protein